MHPLQLAPFERHGFAHRCQGLHFAGQLGRNVGQCAGDFQPQAGEPLHHVFHGDGFHRLARFGLAGAGGLLRFGVRRFARLLHFLLYGGELLLHFAARAFGAHRGFGWPGHRFLQAA